MPQDAFMKHFDLLPPGLTDPAAEALADHGVQAEVLQCHLDELHERLRAIEHRGGSAKALADTRLQMARTLVSLGRGEEAWTLGRAVFDCFLEADDFESAADACDVLFQAERPGSICALGQGIWLAVTCPIDPELSIELLGHVIDETPDDADGAAVAATTALFLADVRAEGKHRDDLMFFTTQLLGAVARRHSGVESTEQLDGWMERLELKDPERFLVRLRNVVDCLVQDDWWFDRAALQERLPFA
jgi:hypothetical protein